MKKAVLVFLILSLCLGLCACGQPQVVEVIPDEYEQFREVFDALVKEEYDSAQALIEAMKPESEKPAIKEVKITTENFFDYFEYVEFPEYGMDIEKDSAGNVTGLFCNPGFYLKEGYTVPEENLKACKVEAGFKYNRLIFMDNRGITVDLENRTYTVTGEASYTDKYDKAKTGYAYRLTQDDPWSFCIIVNDAYLTNGKDNHNTYILSDLELVSASGTLYLYE